MTNKLTISGQSTCWDDLQIKASNLKSEFKREFMFLFFLKVLENLMFSTMFHLIELLEITILTCF